MSDEYRCVASSECKEGGRQGSCEEGYCAFEDPNCETGYRYVSHAPDELAGDCVAPVEVVSFTLMDATLEIVALDPVPEGATISLSDYGSINFRINTVPAVIGSVQSAVNGTLLAGREDIVPYSVFGDDDADYRPWNGAAPGEWTITAIPYPASRPDAPGRSFTIHFSLVD